MKELKHLMNVWFYGLLAMATVLFIQLPGVAYIASVFALIAATVALALWLNDQ